MNVVLVALCASLTTLAGGFFALRFRDHLHLILGFSAGAVAGVALFDLLPEAIETTTIAGVTELLPLAVACGFFGYLLLDRLIVLSTSEEHEGHAHGSPRGLFGVLILSLHSFFDGVAIGVAFQAGAAVGAIVAVAVLAHSFSDGINTVTLVTRHNGSRSTALTWLGMYALMPLLGAAATLVVSLPLASLGLLFAAFTGSFFYLSASDLIPESHHRHPHALTTVMTLIGAGVIWYLVALVR